MAAKPPDAFLSYTRFDDQRARGKISQLRNELADAVRAVTGEPFDIFQDTDGIGLGEHWPGKLDQILDEAPFFIPILTPSYFKSPACRDELDKFLRSEKEKERRDLILPIYYLDCDVLEEPEQRRGDPLATAIHERQRYDWRQLRHHGFSTRKMAIEIERLARAIRDARRRVGVPVPPRRQWPKAVPERPDAMFGTGAAVLTAPSPVGPELSPGTVFHDNDEPWCPELVVIPPGEFMMGSTEAERRWAIEEGAWHEWLEAEKPQHLIRISYPLAVGRYPVTFEEYGHFARTTGRAQPADEGWGRGRRPVINVDWEDAKAFAAWLSVQTGQSYRLLSEAEWEYVCRAGTTTRYWWGDEITRENANYGLDVWKSSEVGKYPANPLGLFDLHGNVWEWVEDCWNDSYEGAPDNGSTWTSGDCGLRVLRGGSWDDGPESLRSACRNRKHFGYGGKLTGFRVARTLTAQPKLEYHDPELTGRVTFNYSNNNGGYSIGRDEFFFETKWSKASDQSIHLYNDPPSIAGVAEAPGIRSYSDVKDPASYDMSSRVRTIQEGEHAIIKNRHSKYAVLRIIDIKDRTRSDNIDELTFEFWILSDTTKADYRANEEETRRRGEEEARGQAAEREQGGAEEAEAKRRTEEGRRRRAPKVLEPGTVFRDVDAPWCPELVVIPPGEFMMGSPDDDPEADDREKPRHRVEIEYALAVGRYPVTYAEYDHFCQSSGEKRPKDWGWGRGRRPVTGISWEDTYQYVEWLSETTGEPYRLLSEAEWEYAARAGTPTRYSWGDSITPENANYRGSVGKTTEVGSYPANPWGLYDMHGNVWEWVEDCLNPNYYDAPSNGSAWLAGHCSDRMVRGGSWKDSPSDLRSARRAEYSRGILGRMLGFRVARTLSRNAPPLMTQRPHSAHA